MSLIGMSTCGLSPMVLVLFYLLATITKASLTSLNDACREVDRDEHPVLCHMTDRAILDVEGLAKDISYWASSHGLLVGDNLLLSRNPTKTSDTIATSATTMERLGQPVDHSKNVVSSGTPVVFAHGMGDSCFNSGMKRITAHVSDILQGAYATCIPIGSTQHEDTVNGYFLNMDATVKIFADAVQQDPLLHNGFHAIGFSQGNNVIRGYIAQYNNPPVKTFVSVNGVNAGVGAVPYCRPKKLDHGLITNQVQDSTDSIPAMSRRQLLQKSTTISFSMCDLLMEQASKRAYTTYAQEHSFQANYWRDPRPVEREAYQTYGQLAQWNNEGKEFHQNWKDNYGKTEKFVWIMAEQDKMVWPKEGEHWGAPDPNDPFGTILPMNETEWYKQDLFGLKTAQEAGKNVFESFEGDHLQFTMEELDGWVIKYFSS